MTATLINARLIASEAEIVDFNGSEATQVSITGKATSHGESESVWTVDSSVEVADAKSGNTLYRGLSRVRAELRVGDTPPVGPAVVSLVWPVLRADLVSQCARVALQVLDLPALLDESILEDTSTQ